MGQILWQYNKSIGEISFGLSIETVNRFTNYGNYAKGLVYLQGRVVDTIWFGSKNDYLERIESISLVSKFFDISAPSSLSLNQVLYLLDQAGEYERYSRFVCFQDKSWFEKYIKEDHYLNRFYHSGNGLGFHAEQYCDVDGVLGTTLRREYILLETEITNNANTLRIEFAIPKQPKQSKTFLLAPYFYKCVKVALILNTLYNIIKNNQYANIWTLPNEISATISWDMKNFINTHKLYPSKI